MEKKCSLPDHKNLDAVVYCQECKIYMCSKCKRNHSGLFINHHQIKIDENIKDIFSGFCMKESHSEKLDYFCKTHNQLCCSSCIIKVKKNGKGQHADCDICTIEDIKLEKINNLRNNINNLENLSIPLQNSINELKIKFEKANDQKEEIKLKIQEIFNKLRNCLNNKEDELFKELDIKFEEICLKEGEIKEYEKLPNKIKNLLIKGKNINNDNWNDENKLNFLLNVCINIENNLKSINLINQEMNKFSSSSYELNFDYSKKVNDDFLNYIKNLGIINIINKNIDKNMMNQNKINPNNIIGNIMTNNSFDQNIMNQNINEQNNINQNNMNQNNINKNNMNQNNINQNNMN